MTAGPTLLARLMGVATGSVRRKLILGIAVVHAVLMTLFVFDLSVRQKDFMHRQQQERTEELARMVALNSRSWVLAGDVHGLGEVITSLGNHPHMRYAMVLDEAGRVLAHTQPDKVGLYLSDDISRGLLTGPRSTRLLAADDTVLDVAEPISIGARSVGWARVSIDLRPYVSAIRLVELNGLFYTLAAIGIGSLLAMLMARGLTRGLDNLIAATGSLGHGRSPVLPETGGNDEVARLATAFSKMAATILSRERSLHDSEMRYRGIFEQAAVGIAHVSIDGHFLTANERLCQITGYPRADLVGLAEESITADEDVAASREHIRRLLESEAASGTFEKRLRRKDGAQVWIANTMSLVRREDGSPHFLIFVIEDITERKEADVRLKAMLDELTRSNTELERFAYVASHDLQEPLRNVVSSAQVLERRLGPRLGEEEREWMTIMVAAAQRMGALVRDLLQYSSINAGDQPFSNVDMSQVTALVRDNLRLALAESSCVLEVGPLPTVSANPIQMIELLQNLIGNALKFRHPETLPRISVQAVTQDDEYLFSVADNGIGIAPEYLDDIFVIFKRLHTATAYPGTGVGLALCRRIVERHKGRIWAEPNPTGGTTFFFTLPKT